MNTFCLEKLSAYFKLNCLGETELQNHGSFKIVLRKNPNNPKQYSIEGRDVK